MICFGGWGAGGGCLGEVCVGFVSASCRLRVTYVGFVQIGIPAMSTTEYSLRGCWGFIPPFGRGLPNYPFQIPFQRRYGGYRFSRQGITSHRMDIFPLPDGHFPIFPSGIQVGWGVKIPFKPSMLNLPSIFSVKYFLIHR